MILLSNRGAVESRPVRERVAPLRGPTMMTRTFRVRGTVGSHPRFAKPDEKCLVGVPVSIPCDYSYSYRGRVLRNTGCIVGL